jgi:hypothetical protein
MEIVLGVVAFAGLAASQLVAVFAVHRVQLDQSGHPIPAATDQRTKTVWESGV